MPESPGAEKQDKEKEHRDSKKNRGETNRRTTHACVDRAACRAAGILVVSLWEKTDDHRIIILLSLHF